MIRFVIPVCIGFGVMLFIQAVFPAWTGSWWDLILAVVATVLAGAAMEGMEESCDD